MPSLCCYFLFSCLLLFLLFIFYWYFLIMFFHFFFFCFFIIVILDLLILYSVFSFFFSSFSSSYHNPNSLPLCLFFFFFFVFHPSILSLPVFSLHWLSSLLSPLPPPFHLFMKNVFHGAYHTAKTKNYDSTPIKTPLSFSKSLYLILHLPICHSICLCLVSRHITHPLYPDLFLFLVFSQTLLP